MSDIDSLHPAETRNGGTSGWLGNASAWDHEPTKLALVSDHPWLPPHVVVTDTPTQSQVPWRRAVSVPAPETPEVAQRHENPSERENTKPRDTQFLLGLHNESKHYWGELKLSLISGKSEDEYAEAGLKPDDSISMKAVQFANRVPTLPGGWSTDDWTKLSNDISKTFGAEVKRTIGTNEKGEVTLKVELEKGALQTELTFPLGMNALTAFRVADNSTQFGAHKDFLIPSPAPEFELKGGVSVFPAAGDSNEAQKRQEQMSAKGQQLTQWLVDNSAQWKAEGYDREKISAEAKKVYGDEGDAISCTLGYNAEHKPSIIITYDNKPYEVQVEITMEKGDWKNKDPQPLLFLPFRNDDNNNTSGNGGSTPPPQGSSGGPKPGPGPGNPGSGGSGAAGTWPNRGNRGGGISTTSVDPIVPPGGAVSTDSAAGKPKEPLGLAGQFLQAAEYAAVQEPVKAVGQLADHLFGTRLEQKLTFMSRPEGGQGKSDWMAQQLGAAAGMLVPFLLVRGGARRLLGDSIKGTQTAATLGMSMKEAAITGFTYDALLKPTDASATNNFWASRGLSGVSGAATFMTLTGSAYGLGKLAESGRLKSLAPVLTNPVSAGILSGIPSGLVAAEGSSVANTNKLASFDEIKQSITGMSFVGGLLGLAQVVKGSNGPEGQGPGGQPSPDKPNDGGGSEPKTSVDPGEGRISAGAGASESGVKPNLVVSAEGGDSLSVGNLAGTARGASEGPDALVGAAHGAGVSAGTAGKSDLVEAAENRDVSVTDRPDFGTPITLPDGRQRRASLAVSTESAPVQVQNTGNF